MVFILKRKDVVIKPQQEKETLDTAKLELYRLIGEGYKVMKDGRI